MKLIKKYIIAYIIIITPIVFFSNIIGINYVKEHFTHEGEIKLKINNKKAKKIKIIHFVSKNDDIKKVSGIIYNLKSTIYKNFENNIDFFTVIKKDVQANNINDIIKSQNINLNKSWFVLEDFNPENTFIPADNDYWKLYLTVNDKILTKKDGNNHYDGRSIFNLKKILLDDIKLIMFKSRKNNEK